MDLLSRPEELLLLAVWRLQDDAYGAAIRQEIHARSGRDVSINAVYTTLDRRLQEVARQAIAAHPVDGAANALVSTKTETGEIIAMAQSEAAEAQ